jgi:tRNA (guanine37-N1)-methyltransferase
MRFDVITLFPELFGPHLVRGVTRRAFESGQVEVRLWQLRDFGDPPHARVDDRPYGGGPGMVLLVEPLLRALAAVRADRGDAEPVPVVNFSPAGEPLRQAVVGEFAAGRGAILLCARYEGVDQRFIDAAVDRELSVGDYVLSGGEIPALALLDAVARLQPGVLGDERSHAEDSFSAGLLDCPHYSRPEVLGDAGAAVPPVLLSGNHAAIARWRRDQALALTAERRPDLVAAAEAAGLLDAADRATLARPRAGKL